MENLSNNDKYNNDNTSQMKLQSFIKTCSPFGITREEATEMWESYYKLRKSNDKALEILYTGEESKK